MKLSLPDVTKAQILAVLQAVVAVAVAFGAPLSQHQQDALLALATVIGTVLVAADVKIRGNRLAHADKIKTLTDPTVRSDAVIATIEKLAGASMAEIQAALSKPQPGGSTATDTAPAKKPARRR